MRDAEFDREFDRALERNRRLLELARHNGYEFSLGELGGSGGGLWMMVPRELGAIAGCMAMRVE